MTLAHPVLRAATTVALATAALAGCSASHHHTSTATAASKGPGASSSAATGADPGAGNNGNATGNAVPSPGPTHGVTDWPTEPAGPHKIPTRVLSAVMAPGYTGQSYLHHLATTWGLTLGAKEKIDFPGETPVWHVTGSAKPAKGTALSVSAVWTLDGNLRSISCTVTRSAPQAAGYLHDCARLDHPGATPASAVAWLEAMTPRVDRAFAAARRTPIDSPLYRSGPTATYLQETKDASGAASYMLDTFGAPAPTKS